MERTLAREWAISAPTDTLTDVENNWLAMGQDAKARETLLEGVPIWAAADIYNWVEEACFSTGSSFGGNDLG